MVSVFSLQKCDIFDELESVICEKFRELQEVLYLRKEVLLSELGLMKEEHRNNSARKNKTIEGLEFLKLQMESLVVRDNIASQFYEKQLCEINREIELNRTSIPPPNLTLNFNIDSLLEQIRRLGDFVQNENTPVSTVQTHKSNSYKTAVDYESKSTPIHSFAKRGRAEGEIKAPRAVHYDPFCDRIFIADGGNSKILICSPNGSLISEFGSTELRSPCGIAVTESYCYITDLILNAICKFELQTFQMLNVSQYNELKEPKGIAIDSQTDELYVVDKNKYNRVWIFNSELNFTKAFNCSLLNSPRDIKVVGDTVYVLDTSEYCLHLFTKQGVKIQSVIRQPELVDSPYFFAVSQDGDFILGGQWDNFLKVFSPQGKLLHRVGYQGVAKECMSLVRGVCVTSDNNIISAFYNGNYAMTLY